MVGRHDLAFYGVERWSPIEKTAAPSRTIGKLARDTWPTTWAIGANIDFFSLQSAKIDAQDLTDFRGTIMLEKRSLAGFPGAPTATTRTKPAAAKAYGVWTLSNQHSWMPHDSGFIG